MKPSVKIYSLIFTTSFFLFQALSATATTYYVDINNPNPTPPYTSWGTAATNIQNAIDQSSPGDLVLVNNGVYRTGGETINGYALSNRVAINKAITVQSVNGPAATVIQGSGLPLGSSTAARCVYLTNNAALIGFTLSAGTTLDYANNIYECSGGGIWCESSNATISNCVITQNWAAYAGGGVYQGTLIQCLISQNSILTLNGSYQAYGGGVYQGILDDCTVVSNSINPAAIFYIEAAFGGGTYNSELTNCVVADNSATTATEYAEGGGAYQGALVNCTITGNSSWYGGGTYNSTMINCIDYFNTSIDPSSINYYDGEVTYCCTTPKFGYGPYDTTFTNDPALASISQISPNSPCRGAGNPAVTTGADIEGNPWANPPSIGCSEPNPGNDLGSLTVGISTAFTIYPPSDPENFQAVISGLLETSVWNFGDGTLVTNEACASHTWAAPGSYTVTLTAYNDSNPTGISATNIINITPALTYYVNLINPNPVAPYRSWSTAAQTIQAAVNVANPGSLVLVTNGIPSEFVTNLYWNGGMTAPNGLFYRVAVTNPITVQSVNGPNATIIMGDNNGKGYPSQAGCIYLTNGATLIGFTLTNGATYGGIYATSTNVVITNCVITHCSSPVYPATHSGTFFNCLLTNSTGAIAGVLDKCILAGCGEDGCLMNDCVISNAGGAYGGVLNHCLISRNSSMYGGGAYGDSGNPIVLNNCVISNNAAQYDGGGAYGTSCPNFTNCILNNCIVVSNSASAGGGAYQAQLNNCIVISNRLTYTGGNGGGGVYDCLLNSCSLIGNTTTNPFSLGGGGAYNSTLNNCSLIGNISANMGGGAYSGLLNNCMLVSNTAATGGGAYNCTLNQCAVMNNIAIIGGGGVANSTLNDCLIGSNLITAPQYNFFGGGGADRCTMTNCLLTYNIGGTNGGAAFQSTLVNCTVVYNTGGLNGGIFDCQADNCILYYNTGGDYFPGNSQYPLNYCCTLLPPTNGVFNITNAPLFVNPAANDFHLQSNSPCINAGNNAYVATATDLTGNPRIVGGTVDIGAYEYQSPVSMVSYQWLEQYGLSITNNIDASSPNGTAFNVYQDWIAGLNPTNPASVLVMLPVTTTNTTSGITVTWQSVSGILYNLQRATNLVAQPSFITIQSNIVGQAGTTSYKDTAATNHVSYFYRVGVP